MRRIVFANVLFAALLVSNAAFASGDAKPVKDVSWPWEGMFGSYDKASLQRGLQVYKNICSGCHGLHRIAYRNLAALGYSEDQIKAYAKEYEVQNAEPNDQGEMYMRPARPSDRFVGPFPNEQAARAANNGAYPPDLSLIIKARAHGPNYVYSILTGYTEPPAGVHVMEGLNYNPYFPSDWIGMPPPLSDGAVEYTDGTKATVDQMAKDVTSFLTWASMPELEARKGIGLRVLIFLVVLTGLLIAVKKKVWSDVH